MRKSSFLSALQTSQVLDMSMDAQLTLLNNIFQHRILKGMDLMTNFRSA